MSFQGSPIALIIALLAVPAAAQYEVKINPGTRQLELELALPPHADPVEVSARGAGWGLQSQVQDVKCGKESLERRANGAWIVPAECRRVSWTVIPDLISDGGADPSKQRTLAVGSGPWFLLAEPTSLLRPLGRSGPSSISDTSRSDRLVGATPVGSDHYEVPAANHAPEFYVLGPAAVVERTVGDFDVTYVADEPSRVRRLRLDQLHAKALSYLSAVVRLPKSNPDPSRSLLVIWLAAGQLRGPLGGAAGSRSFVANYVIDKAADEKRNRSMTLAITAHEQFHQLVDMLRGEQSPLPVWLSESLAQYYALKALLHADDSQAAREIRNEFIDPARAVSQRLLELNRRHASGDRSAYTRFYSEGATLWGAVDSAITAATHGEQSLDDYVKELLVSQLPGDGTLPRHFIDRLQQVAGPQINQIFEKYVGR